MTKYSLDDIKIKAEELAIKIGAPLNALPSYGQLKWDAHPYVEVDALGFMYLIISERGEEYQRRMTDNLDDLLYWIFADVTFSMACTYELRNRIEDKDSRRIIFDKQEELLSILSPTWGDRERKEHAQILKDHPFDDLAGLRATYWGELRKQGHSETEIERMVKARYSKKLKKADEY